MLIPKKVKFRKWQTGRSNSKTRGADTRGTKLSFGSFGLKSETQARVKSTQIESARKVISRTLTKSGKYWVRIFPQGYCFDVFPGRIIFEVDGAEEKVAHEALRKAGSKLPLKTRIVGRAHKQ